MNPKFYKRDSSNNSWWIILISIIPFLLILYYTIGAMIIENIDKDLKNQVYQNENIYHSHTIEAISFIIDREVNQKLWTPNLPFFFPSYFLDNMPNFQLGMMEAASTTGEALSKTFLSNGEMNDISKLLSYSGTIWMFSPTNNLKPVSSANTQYRKARKELNHFNQSIKEKEIFFKTQDNLKITLQLIKKDINKSIATLEKQIVEHSGSFNNKNDDIFYYTQGKLYAYYIIIDAIGKDYKEVILNDDIYEEWTKIISSLERASTIDPSFVRNGKIDNGFSTNHLIALAFYASKVNLDICQIELSFKREE